MPREGLLSPPPKNGFRAPHKSIWFDDLTRFDLVKSNTNRQNTDLIWPNRNRFWFESYLSPAEIQVDMWCVLGLDNKLWNGFNCIFLKRNRLMLFETQLKPFFKVGCPALMCAISILIDSKHILQRIHAGICQHYICSWLNWGPLD